MPFGIDDVGKHRPGGVVDFPEAVGLAVPDPPRAPEGSADRVAAVGDDVADAGGIHRLCAFHERDDVRLRHVDPIGRDQERHVGQIEHGPFVREVVAHREQGRRMLHQAADRLRLAIGLFCCRALCLNRITLACTTVRSATTTSRTVVTTAAMETRCGSRGFAHSASQIPPATVKKPIIQKLTLMIL